VREESSDGSLIGEDHGSVNAARRNVRVTGEDHLRVLERSGSVPAPGRTGGLDESGGRVIEGGDFTAQQERLDVADELRPTIESVLAGDDELRVGKVERRATNRILRLVLEPWVMTRDAVKRCTRSLYTSAEKIFRLLLGLFEVGLIG
jgi:hypothetical protein